MPLGDKYKQEGSWGNNSTPTYLLQREGVSAEQVDAKIKNLITKHRPESTNETLFLHASSDWYLRSNFKNGQYAGGGRIVYVRLFGIVAGFVLLIACINFMNLSTARATGRAKEVGVRKAVGATKSSLVGQFLSESLLMSGLAGLLALIILSLHYPSLTVYWQNKSYWRLIIHSTCFLSWVYCCLRAFWPAFIPPLCYRIRL